MKIIRIAKEKYPYVVCYKVDGAEKETNIKFEAIDNYAAQNIAQGIDEFYDYPNAFVKLDREELNARKARQQSKEDAKNLGNNWWDD